MVPATASRGKTPGQRGCFCQPTEVVFSSNPAGDFYSLFEGSLQCRRRKPLPIVIVCRRGAVTSELADAPWTVFLLLDRCSTGGDSRAPASISLLASTDALSSIVHISHCFTTRPCMPLMDLPSSGRALPDARLEIDGNACNAGRIDSGLNVTSTSSSTSELLGAVGGSPAVIHQHHHHHHHHHHHLPRSSSLRPARYPLSPGPSPS